jgi:hypothetical protein
MSRHHGQAGHSLKVIRRGDMAMPVGTSTFSGVFKGKPFEHTVNMLII